MSRLAPPTMPGFVLAELAAWQDKARGWPLTCTIGEPHLRCGECGQSVIVLADEHGRGYIYPQQDAITLVTAHIRQVHDDGG